MSLQTESINYQGTEFEVCFDYLPGSNATWDSPPEYPEIEIISVLFKDIDITDEGAFEDIITAIDEEMNSKLPKPNTRPLIKNYLKRF